MGWEKGRGKPGQREAAITEDTEGRDVTTEDASKVGGEEMASGREGGRGGYVCGEQYRLQRSGSLGARQTGTSRGQC